MKAGWEVKTLGDALAVVRNGLNCKQSDDLQGVPISRIETIARGSINFDRVGRAQITENQKAKYKLRQGDILFSHINSPPHVGKTAILKSTAELYHGVNLLLFRPEADIDQGYLEHYLKYLHSSGYWRSRCKQSVNQASVNQTDIKKVRFPKPPLEEQMRIVSILDEAFEGLDRARENAEANLKSARELFDSARSSVFANLLDTAPLAQLGELCSRVSVGHVGETSKHYVTEGGVPFIRSQNVRPSGIDLQGVAQITHEFHQSLKKSQLVGGELLFVRVGANRGQCCSLPLGLGDLNCANIVFGRPKVGDVKYMEHYCQSIVGQENLLGMTTGSAQGVINTKSVATLTIPMPNPSVQAQVVTKLDALMNQTAKSQSHYQTKLQDISDLRQSLLQKAFAGELT